MVESQNQSRIEKISSRLVMFYSSLFIFHAMMLASYIRSSIEVEFLLTLFAVSLLEKRQVAAWPDACGRLRLSGHLLLHCSARSVV